ncbi:hypothetical protein [Fodinicola feengrottensis]|uniref:hypothetical protein n=1 Tax=Fodinicola feengrottensis TaxID=435914 RepID=UPI0013CF7379|nr:hypothetical protein [Fodinicola feengrottensis]
MLFWLSAIHSGSGWAIGTGWSIYRDSWHSFFSALARRPGDRLTVVGGCGHVVLPLQAMESVRTGVRDWLNLNPPSDARQQ